MINMIKADLYRIFKGKAIYIVLFAIIVLSLICVIGLTPGHIGMTSMTDSRLNIDDEEFVGIIAETNSIKDLRRLMKSYGGYELDQAVLGTNVNLYYVFIVIVVIVLCTDFSNKSIKNTLSSAISRNKYYWSKAILIFLICTFLVLFNNYFFYFTNLLINGKDFASSFGDIFKSTMIQFPLIYGIMSLLICFAFLFKKTATFNTIAIPFIMVFQLLVLGIINLFRIKADWFYQYEIQNALSNLVNHPTSEYILRCALLGFFYMILFTILGYYAFKNTEIQ
ncbi:MAG: hypothetical protein K2I72_01675 [Bacilli bacterium]|nr:hypothetical protein [Bacilli bacterium]